MNARRFCIRIGIVSALILALAAAVNYFIDEYGLFHDVRGKSISIYSDERTAKYLLAYNYVPANFEAYIIGPSLSANLNPKAIPNYKIYNLSMMGANITEQRAVAEKAMEKATPKFVIVCLHPYLTADHGMKTGMINPREYYGALGSVSLYKSYVFKFIRDRQWMPAKFPAGQFNDYGCNHYNIVLQKIPVEEKIRQQLNQPDAIRTAIDPVAWIEFTGLIDEFRSRNIEVIAYFHPLPFVLYDKFREPLTVYQQKVTGALQGKATLIDFNDAGHEFFTKDLSNYIDHGHLSDKGGSYLMSEILRLSHKID